MTTTKRRTEPENVGTQFIAPQTAPEHERNPGMPLDLDWIHKVHINRSAVERRAATMNTRRTVKKEWQAAWLLRAITCIDLTTLSGDDTPGNVLRLCAKARQPVRQDVLEAIGAGSMDLKVGAVCVYHNLVPVAVEVLRASGIPVAAVSTGFPAGQNPFEQKLEEIVASVKAGATEIDIVISRAHVLTGNWQSLYDEVKAFRAACGDAHMKTILATHELATLRNVGMASLVCMMAGADFIKTSTGKEAVNATLPVGLVMVRAIREYLDRTGYKVGFKPAGGIRSAKESLDWLILMKEELGNEWLNNRLFRIGASGLLSDIERQLSYFATALANNTRYGLAASVWSENINLALDVAPKLKAGSVWVNCTNLFDASSGFGGYRESGFGRESGKEGLYEYVRPAWETGAGSTNLAPSTNGNVGAQFIAPKEDDDEDVGRNSLRSYGDSASSNGFSAFPPIDRTPKMFIKGKQARPDSGYSRDVYDPEGHVIGVLCQAALLPALNHTFDAS